jgi:HPr kinase/phosphorylase
VEIQVHGALLEVLGVGVLLTGPSGVGKSECALELVQRRHLLVADDVVKIRSQEISTEAAGASRSETSVVIGWAPELIRHYMEIRGIGLLYVPDLYGPESVCESARIELICRLEQWREDADYERVGLERPNGNLVGVAVPMLTLPVRPARSMATLVEVAVRDHLQRRVGQCAAFKLDERMRGRTASDGRTSDETKSEAGG